MPASATRSPAGVQNEDEHGLHPSLARYFWVWVSLTGLTIVTWWVSRIEVGPSWHVVIALAIATLKAALVLFFFMHLGEARGSIPLVGAVTLVLLLVLIAFSLLDLKARFEGTLPQPDLEHGAIK